MGGISMSYDQPGQGQGTGSQPDPGGYQQSGQQQNGYRSPVRPPYQDGPGQPLGRRRPPQGPWPRRHPVWSVVIAVFTVIFVIGAAQGIARSGHKQTPVTGTAPSSATAASAVSTQPSSQASRSLATAPAARVKSKAKTKSRLAGSKIDAESNACDNRPNASGDIYVWMLVPGVQAEAQELGGEWRWDYGSNKCLTSVQLTLAAAPTNPGTCTQVGYVADNPGYDVNATPAKRLKVFAGEVGPAC
jgi:hypothetical protein